MNYPKDGNQLKINPLLVETLFYRWYYILHTIHLHAHQTPTQRWALICYFVTISNYC